LNKPTCHPIVICQAHSPAPGISGEKSGSVATSIVSNHRFVKENDATHSLSFLGRGCGRRAKRQHFYADQAVHQFYAFVLVADQASVVAGRRAWAGARSVGAICTARRASPGTATRFKPGSYRLPALVRLNRPGGAACSSRACSERLRKSCEGSGKMTIATRRDPAE